MDDAAAKKWIRRFVLVGLLIRIWHFAVDHTIWYDEAVLLANILDLDFIGLLGPTKDAVAAPPIFMWLLKSIQLTCGDVTYCWRFPPFLFSCATLFLTVPLVRRTLTPAVGVIAVGLVAISDNHVWMGCCIKPYAGDAFVTTALLDFYIRSETWSPVRRLLILAGAIPFLLSFSYPAAFVVGGILLATGLQLRGAGPLAFASWILAGAASLGTFAWLYFVPIRNQKVNSLVTEWERMYPNWNEPWMLPVWIVDHTAMTFQYVFNPIGFYLFAVAIFGVAMLWNHKRRAWLVVLLAPFVLAMVAASLRAYPYGFNRLMFFISPCALLLGGHGIEALLKRFPSPRIYRFTAIGLLAVLAIIPVYHLFSPWLRPDSQSAVRYLKEQRQPGDRVSSDEQTYRYFFHGELESLEETAQTLPTGGRVWVPMDFYTTERRRAHIEKFFAPAGIEFVSETQFRDCAIYLYTKRGN